MGKISEKINEMIDSVLLSADFTSASPGHINEVYEGSYTKEDPDFESDIIELIKQESKNQTNKSDSEVIKQKTEVKGLTERVKEFDKGNIGEIHRFTSDQFANVRSIATNPTGFMFQTFMKKFARGAGVVALALLIFEAVKWIIGELMKPGRMLDRRFKRDINNEILAFRSREEKQKIRQGINNVIITSIGGLRGGYNQVVSSRGLVATGTIDRVINSNFGEPGTTQVATGQQIKTRIGKGANVFGGSR